MTKRIVVFASCVLLSLVPSGSAYAGGWATVHRHVHKTGQCGGAREVLATLYSIGTKTTSGEKIDPHSLTAASHEYPLGTTITATNPSNGKTCSVRINDRGPFGKARQMGVKIDFASGAARCLGMHGTQYICAP
jgi:rare lipoprotein A (peptidoglycan hydrolase)